MNDNFMLYRVNLVTEAYTTLFTKPIEGDDDILKLLHDACKADHDKKKVNQSSVHEWSLRHFATISDATISQAPLILISLSRSTLSQEGTVVTNQGLSVAESVSQPPLASSITMIVYLERHLVAVEQNSRLQRSDTWRRMFGAIIRETARGLGKAGGIELEPVSEFNDLIESFQSFEKLTRLKVFLRVPNPDLTRYTKRLRDEMKNGGIREYLQDMRNPDGLVRDEGQLPHATVAVAADGYKDGEVHMEGQVDGEAVVVKTGEDATKVALEGVKDYVRGLAAGEDEENTKKVLNRVVREINKKMKRA